MKNSPYNLNGNFSVRIIFVIHRPGPWGETQRRGGPFSVQGRWQRGCDVFIPTLARRLEISDSLGPNWIWFGLMILSKSDRSILLGWCNLRVICMYVENDPPLTHLSFSRGECWTCFHFWCCKTDFFHLEPKRKQTDQHHISPMFQTSNVQPCCVDNVWYSQNNREMRETSCLATLDFA